MGFKRSQVQILSLRSFKTANENCFTGLKDPVIKHTMFFGKQPNPDPIKKETAKDNFEDRRRYKRVSKSFILSYYDKGKPQNKYEITQLKNISLGGMCFITSQSFPPGTVFGVELRTPYITESIYLEGQVQQSHEKMKNLLYETRLKFDKLDPLAEFVLTKMTAFFMNGDNK